MRKILYFLAATLMFTSCSETDFVDNSAGSLAKDRLIKQPYYTINKCYDEIVEYQFYADGNYHKIFYKDQDFTEIEKEISDKVEYINEFDVIIYDNGIVLECKVADDNSDGNIELYCINREYKDAYYSYDVKRTLYTTKEQAVTYQDEDCP
jgi:hypothetical protein